MNTRTLRNLVACTAMLAMTLPLTAEEAAERAPSKKPLVQIAILLDTSNSMDGLVEQAKTRLWNIVNEFANATRDGQRPEVQVALYHYGTPSLGADNGYIKQLSPLTTDLDKISEKLFALKTNGGDEYCGTVIKAAVDQLAWSEGRNDYKAIFIAGNEPFTQGSVDFAASCKSAITRGIIVNTIHCGDQASGISGKWKDGADLADGSYFCINQNEVIPDIKTPFDKELAELNTSVNDTYLSFGKHGAAGKARQTQQDGNAAASHPQAAAARIATKSSSLYKNSEWDIVDAVQEETVKLEEMKEEDLPEPMKKLDPKERKAYVEKKAEERKAIQAKIAGISKQRAEYIAAEQKKLAAAAGTNTLDAAVIQAIRIQAERSNFKF